MGSTTPHVSIIIRAELQDLSVSAPFQGVCLFIRWNHAASKKVYFSKPKIYACVMVAQ